MTESTPGTVERNEAQGNGVAASAPASSSAGGDKFAVHNPATGEVVTHVKRMDASEVAAAVERGRAAQPGWEALGFEGRAKVFKRAQKWLLDNADRIVETSVEETGKTYNDVLGVEISYMAIAFEHWAKHAEGYLAEERVKGGSPFVLGRKLIVRYAPVGVVGVIGPWNYPLANSFGDALPALAAGNAVVLKPSEVTPLTSLLMEEAMRECGTPENVFQVVTGEGETGAALVDEVDFVMFTGSTATGKKVMARAAETLTPVSLELGGKDPMIVLRDADLERAANAAVYYSMQNAGQTCISVERVYVEDPVYDEFVGKVTEKVSALRQGQPSPKMDVDVGAIIFPPQMDTISAHVEDARAKGAKVPVGGKRGAGPGDYWEPTVMTDVDHTMDCMRDETFGPTLPVMRVRDEEQAIELANDSPYGLMASVWSKDTRRGERVARRIEAGSTLVNDHQISYGAVGLPMGGWKTSGLGSRHGADGIRKYTRKQAIAVAPRLTPKRDVHFFPYSARTTKIMGRLVKLIYGRGPKE